MAELEGALVLGARLQESDPESAIEKEEEVITLFPFSCATGGA
jgi:hypothetical protein